MICTSKLIGDVNGDGIVDQADADLLFNWVSYPNERETTYKLTCPENADVTGNGKINIGDATLLMNHVAYPDDPAYALAQPEPEHLTGYIEPPHIPGEPGILIPTDEPHDEPYDDYTPPDPCEGVVCDSWCEGSTLHTSYCKDGVCIPGLVHINHPDCITKPPDDEPNDEPYDDFILPSEEPPEKDKSLMCIIIAIVLGAFAFLLG
ncbi:dockerin type I repeat-containing protein [candidate division WOR-3 bacterium]|nr:dockerin type I repeat-containing protein [candidate division WOR-3 bacterium]